jgi:hypothetical protein
VGINRIAHQIDRWTKRPRFRAPATAIVLPVLLAAGLLVSLTRGSSAPPAPPRLPPLPRVEKAPAPPPVTVPPVQIPAEPAEPGCPHGCAEPPPGCDIKGNISTRTGERIYHLPGQRYYDSTVISPAKGEAWFCTEAEAGENGWRKSKR